MDLGIAGKRALVLASSQGLGLGIATKLCDNGANVIVGGRVEEKLISVVEELNRNGTGSADYVVADPANYVNIEDQDLAAWLGAIDAGHESYIFGQCFSGGMLEELLQPVRITGGLPENEFGAAAANPKLWENFCRAIL